MTARASAGRQAWLKQGQSAQCPVPDSSGRPRLPAAGSKPTFCLLGLTAESRVAMAARASPESLGGAMTTMPELRPSISTSSCTGLGERGAASVRRTRWQGCTQAGPHRPPRRSSPALSCAAPALFAGEAARSVPRPHSAGSARLLCPIHCAPAPEPQLSPPPCLHAATQRRPAQASAAQPSAAQRGGPAGRPTGCRPSRWPRPPW